MSKTININCSGTGRDTSQPQRSKEYMNFEKCPQISENRLQWHYFICVCR